MTRNDYDKFEELLKGMYSFYRVELTAFHLQVWWAAMKAYSYDGFKDAMNRHVMNPDNGQFLPKPADVVKLVDGSTEDRALMAWSQFEIAVQYVGSHESVVFDDPIIHAVVADMGGWPALCAKTDKDWPFVRNEFVTRYRAYSMKQLTGYPAKLIGHGEAHNAASHPQFVRPPVFIGDEKRARLVLQHGAQDAQPTRRINAFLPPMRHLAEKL